MYRNKQKGQEDFFCFVLIGLLYKKTNKKNKSGNIHGCSIAMKDLVLFLFCGFASFSVFFFFFFLIFLLSTKRDGAITFIIPITDSKHLQQSYFVYCLESKPLCH